MTPDASEATLMIVDDEPANLNVLSEMLRGAGWAVRAFPRGELALAAARDEPPALVLLDIRMPDMDGYEVCRRFKADARLQAIPILFISALSEAEDIAAGFGCGGVDYIGKPVREFEVLARVRTHLALREAYAGLAAEHAQLRLLESHRDMLTHMLVHDMRSPLQVIGGHLELIAGNAANRQSQADDGCSLQAAIHGVRVLSQMVSTVVDLSRLEAAVVPLHQEVVPVAAIFRAACDQALDPANAHRLVQRIAAACPPVLCDVDLTVRIVANLVTNALKHAADAGRIVLGADPDPNGVRVWVRDQGSGIPACDQQRIFEKFGVAGLSSGRAAVSTGLGLAFCKLAVAAQGGTIGVESRTGAGSTFWFTLPRGRDDFEF